MFLGNVIDLAGMHVSYPPSHVGVLLQHIIVQSVWTIPPTFSSTVLSPRSSRWLSRSACASDQPNSLASSLAEIASSDGSWSPVFTMIGCEKLLTDFQWCLFVENNILECVGDVMLSTLWIVLVGLSVSGFSPDSQGTSASPESVFRGEFWVLWSADALWL